MRRPFNALLFDPSHGPRSSSVRIREQVIGSGGEVTDQITNATEARNILNRRGLLGVSLAVVHFDPYGIGINSQPTGNHITHDIKVLQPRIYVVGISAQERDFPDADAIVSPLELANDGLLRQLEGPNFTAAITTH